MQVGYKFRLYPTQEQATLIQKTFGCARFVYNHYLDQRRMAYKETGKSPTRFQQDKDLTQLKKALPWLAEVDSRALKYAVKNLDNAYQRFFQRVKKGERPYGYYYKAHFVQYADGAGDFGRSQDHDAAGYQTATGAERRVA